MDHMKKASIAIIVALALMCCWVLTGCTSNDEVKSVQMIINGKKIAGEATAKIENNRLMVSKTFLQKAVDLQLNHYYSGKVAVLMYHDIAKNPDRNGIISVEHFEKQMQLVKENGFQVIDIETYTSFILGTGTVPDNALLITFDDGYESFYKLAYPILKKYAYAAVNFVIVSSIDDRDKPGTPKLTWEQMREMQQHGMSFRSHTYDLHQYGIANENGNEAPIMSKRIYNKAKMRMESSAEFQNRIKTDLLKAEERLRLELGNTQSTLAFPFGAYSKDALEMTEKLGIAVVFTTKAGINSKLNRIGYRINGASAGETAEQLLDKLIGYGSSTGEEIHFEKMLNDWEKSVRDHVPEDDSSMSSMIILRDFCNYYKWKINWNAQKRIVEIQTKQLT